MAAAVRLEQATFRYPGSRAGVIQLDLSIEPGELLVCVGPSGCGKTTLLRLIAGFIAPDSGRVLIGGTDQAGIGARGRDCGIVFQSYALFPMMRVWENVAYPLRVRGVPLAQRRERAHAMLASTGLTSHADRLPMRLSGGQQQRVALARALVFEPKALLLDEPLSALDAATRMQMRDEIRRIQRQQRIATLLITHDQDEALSMGDRVAVLRDGRLEQVATPRHLYDHPANGFVAGFIGRANLLEATIRSPTGVQTAAGLLTVPTHALKTGTAVRLLIRPERIVPETDAAEPTGRNRLAVRIVRDAFHGAARQIEVQLAGQLSHPAATTDSADATDTLVAATLPITLRIETTLRHDFKTIRIPPEAVQFLPVDSTLNGDP